MLKVTLITVGKVKEQYLRDGIAEYSKRLGRYCKLEILDVKDEKTPDGASDVVETQIKKKEADRIMALISDDSYVLSLAIEGKQFDSVEFANKIDKLPGRGVSHLVFIIGGSLGLHDIIKKRSEELISFSKMTFPHQLMQLIFLEQLYRGFRIINKEPYHK